ncbi:MAG: PQQ-dependent sugar dehydrogenase [Polaromonas sp.]|nr:PQQ-dependent sugar dehydrogenase [Polaromonas sp.]
MIRKGSRPFTIFSRGHRNSQGIFLMRKVNKFSKLARSSGGDEINIIRKGVHYGWPHDTYGTDYSLDTESQQFHANKGDVIYGHHDRYEKPIYAFTPSIGIAAIKRMPKTQWEFPNWRRVGL